MYTSNIHVCLHVKFIFHHYFPQMSIVWIVPAALLYPHTLTPQHIYTRRRREPDPLADAAQTLAHAARLVEPPLQEGPGLAVAGRPVVRHEQLRRGVDDGEGATLGVPRRVDGGVAGEEVDLVGEGGEFTQRRGDVGRLGHYG